MNVLRSGSSGESDGKRRPTCRSGGRRHSSGRGGRASEVDEEESFADAEEK